MDSLQWRRLSIGQCRFWETCSHRPFAVNSAERGIRMANRSETYLRILKWNILIKIHEIISFLWTAILRMAFWRSQSVIRHADNQRSDFNCFLPLWRRIPGEDSPAKKAKLWMNPVRALCPSSAFYRWHSDRFSSLRFFCKTKLSLSECQRNL